jgi:hypothetical protein
MTYCFPNVAVVAAADDVARLKRVMEKGVMES